MVMPALDTVRAGAHPSVLDAQADEFGFLVDRLRALSQAPATCLTADRWSRLLARELAWFSAQLEQHVADEEPGGYMSDVVDRCPEFQRRADRLHVQHADFVACARSLLEAARQHASPADIQASIGKLLDAVEVHEHAETSLIQDAWQVDIGSGD